ncbi:MAG: hypothetical protein IJK18_08370 [Clostridia bacterium]|nr:hypothetical protein [Clostridia bacterium]
MAKETQIGNLVIDLQIKTAALEKGLNAAKTKLKELEQENEQIKSSNKGVDASFVAMAAGIVASLAKIKSAVDDGIQKYNQYTNQMKALQKTSIATGNSFGEVKKAVEDVNSLKLMDESDVTTATKNLLTYGFTIEQTSDMLKVLQDAAVGNRQANYTLSEAVRVTTEGIRMENSVLSDAAGVQKNIAKMYEEYAKSIGKTTDKLTQAEKVQAVYNGTMAEASMFAGSAKEMADGYQGTQAQLNASTLELSRTLGESMTSSLNEVNKMWLGLTKGLNSFIKDNKSATAGVVSFVATMGTAVVAIGAVIKVAQSLKTAVDLLNISATTLKTTMGVAFGASIVIAGIAAIKTAVDEQKQAQEKLNEVTERYKQIKEGTYQYQDDSLSKLEDETTAIEKQRELLEKKIQLEQQEQELLKKTGEETTGLGQKTSVLANAQNNNLGLVKEGNTELLKVRASLSSVNKEYNESVKSSTKFGNSVKELDEKLKINKKGIKEATALQKIKSAMDTDSVRTQKQQAAQLKLNANQMQKYLNTVKKGNKSTNDYKTAVQELTKAYPEAVNAEGVMVDTAQQFINKEQDKADASLNAVQAIINGNTDVINSIIAMAREAENDEAKQTSLAKSIGIEYSKIIPTLTTILGLLAAIGNSTPEQTGGTGNYYTPKVSTGGGSRRSSGGGSKSYQNKKLDNYKELIEYKKSMDQISLKQEIKMYQTALKKYAKTTSEKRELRVKLHELEKELSDAEAERLQKNLEKQVDTVEASMDKRIKAEGAAYDPKERQKDYDKLISVHQKYLDKVLKSTKISSDKKKEIYKEELEAIRDYETEKRSLMVESVDNTVSQLTNAITKRLEELEESEKKIVENNIKLVESWKEARINAINEEYNARIDAIQKELDLLDKSEEEKTRAEEDAEYERKRNRLQDLIDFEHDATNRANYQKELDKLVADYQKTLDKRALDDKKETLRAEQDLLKDQQSSLIEATENEADAQKEQYENQITAIEDYYKKQQDNAQKTAEKMLLNVKDNQSQILSLLKNYGDEYEITGQSLGEKLAQGINKGLADKIQSVIQTLQDTIDTNLERKIMGWTGTGTQAISGSNVSSKSVVVNQNNYIQQNPEMPSETYRKLKTIDENLAAQLAGV